MLLKWSSRFFVCICFEYLVFSSSDMGLPGIFWTAINMGCSILVLCFGWDNFFGFKNLLPLCSWKCDHCLSYMLLKRSSWFFVCICFEYLVFSSSDMGLPGSFWTAIKMGWSWMCTHHIYPYCGFPGEKYRVFGVHLLCSSNVTFVNDSLKLALFAFKGPKVWESSKE